MAVAIHRRMRSPRSTPNISFSCRSNCSSYCFLSLWALRWVANSAQKFQQIDRYFLFLKLSLGMFRSILSKKPSVPPTPEEVIAQFVFVLVSFDLQHRSIEAFKPTDFAASETIARNISLAWIATRRLDSLVLMTWRQWSPRSKPFESTNYQSTAQRHTLFLDLTRRRNRKSQKVPQQATNRLTRLELKDTATPTGHQLMCDTRSHLAKVYILNEFRLSPSPNDSSSKQPNAQKIGIIFDLAIKVI